MKLLKFLLSILLKNQSFIEAIIAIILFQALISKIQDLSYLYIY